MKRTHKLKQLGDVTAIMATSKTVTEAAKRLGVRRETCQRWIQGGKIPRPTGSRTPPAAGQRRASTAPNPSLTPEAWASEVRSSYDLTATEAQLLDLAVGALTIARNPESRPADALSAMGRFASLVKQLNLETEESQDGEVETTNNVRQFPRSVAG